MANKIWIYNKIDMKTGTWHCVKNLIFKLLIPSKPLKFILSMIKIEIPNHVFVNVFINITNSTDH